ncbi:FtsX-like permease family protein [soil metagenome]
MLTVIGVALGVAVFVAIDLANESAVQSFKDTVREVAGSAQLTVRGNGVGLPGTLLEKVAAVPGIGSVSPLITGRISAPAADGQSTQSLTLLGVDLLESGENGEREVRDFGVTYDQTRSLTEFLTNPNLIVLTKTFAEKRGLKVGGTQTFDIAGRKRELIVGGIIDGGDMADAMDGAIAVVDIAMADALLRRQGLIDRIDVTLREGVSVEDAQKSIQAAVPNFALVDRPERRGAQVDEMLRAFRFNLRALGQVSILVGAFLIYNAMSVAVVRRRGAIGTLRAMGAGRGAIRNAFLLEGALLGITASVLGICMGVAMARGLLGAVSQAISINFVPTNATHVALAPATFLLAGSLGIFGAAAASLGPAREAASTPPANTMRAGTAESGRAKTATLLLCGAACFAAMIPLLLRTPRPGVPIGGYAAAVLLIGGAVLWSRPTLSLVTALLRPLYARVFRAEGLLAARATQSMPGRASVAVCGLLVSLAMAISVSVMVASFRSTVIAWMEQILVADVYVTAAVIDPAERPEPFSAGAIEAVAALPEVDTIDAFRLRQFSFRGRPANLGAGNLTAARFRNAVQDGRDAQAAMRAAKESDEVIVSESFARKNDLKRGDSIPIPTQNGEINVRIAAVYFDFSSEQGYVIMDRSLYLKHFDDPQIDSMAIYLKPGAARNDARKNIRAALSAIPQMPDLDVTANESLRNLALAAFDRTFAITRVLQLIAIAVSVLGVTATLLAQILDRRRETETLRAIGATRARVAKIIVLEASLIGAAGIIPGVAAGVIMSWILTRLIMLESFGWTIQFHVPWLTVLRIAALVYACTIVGALLPARQAAR